MKPDRPLVSVVLAVRDGERYLGAAVESVLAQTLAELELIVVDDASSDATPVVLRGFGDPRITVVRNDEQLGLARSLNLALDRARGRFVARLDADDVAFPRRLEREVARLQAGGLGIVGSAVLDIDAAGRPRALHEMPRDPLAVRWHALFGSPFYHPTVVLDRELLERLALRYDERYQESEDYDLWVRLLDAADGANLPEPLVLYRVHSGQATQRRRGIQRELQRKVALRAIAAVAPRLETAAAELAWRFGAGEEVPPGRLDDAVLAYLELAAGFGSRYGTRGAGAAAQAAARTLARRGRIKEALELDRALPLRALSRRVRREASRRRAIRRAEALLPSSFPRGPVRVTVVAPEPTPYRAPVFDRLSERPELDLTVVYSGRSLMSRTWHVEPRHRAKFLAGVPLPGARRVVHHEVPVTPGIFETLVRSRPDAVVVVGWSTFASQAAVVWCRRRGVPYVLEVDSHDEGPRSGWRQAIKRSVVPWLVRGAAGVLVTGTLVRRSMLAYGAVPERIRFFPVTIDAQAFGEQADLLAGGREEIRRGLGVDHEDVVVLSAARLSPEKGLDTLVRAVAAAGHPGLVVMIAGEGPERPRLAQLARTLGVRLLLLGDRPWERMVETYVTADVFCLLSEREPWGVVVNEAAACGLPLVLSDRVGAAADLLRDGENGVLVPARDVPAAAAALARLASDPSKRLAAGARSRDLMREWGYGPGIETFVETVREAVTSR